MVSPAHGWLSRSLTFSSSARDVVVVCFGQNPADFRDGCTARQSHVQRRSDEMGFRRWRFERRHPLNAFRCVACSMRRGSASSHPVHLPRCGGIHSTCSRIRKRARREGREARIWRQIRSRGRRLRQSVPQLLRMRSSSMLAGRARDLCRAFSGCPRASARQA